MPVNVALVGAGQVGKAVLEQLSLPALRPRFRVFLLSNSRYQVVLKDGEPQMDNAALLKLLPSSASKDAPSSAPSKGVSIQSWSVNELIRDLCARPLHGHTLVIDCTSNEQMAESYPILLQNGVHVVTASKKAVSGTAELWDAIQANRFPKGGLLYHEASVMAGLPVLSTLNDLVATGDHIYKIEGVFSGTLSYIFNHFSKPGSDPAPAFSAIVKQAKDNGYTEPHPADDLDGSDVGRKLTILARLSGFKPLPKGYASVPTESLVPQQCQGIKSGDEFVEALKAHDEAFEKRRKDALGRNKVLRYVGSIDTQKQDLSCGLQEVDFSHPFCASLGDSGNIVSFTTERYPRPVIIQGGGAGAPQTASGVVSDCLRIAERLGV